MPHAPKPSPLEENGRKLMRWVEYHQRQDVNAGGSAGDGTGSGTGRPPKPPAQAGPGWWFWDEDSGQWIWTNPGGEGDDGTTSTSTYTGSSGPTLAEQLAILEAKYKWDSKLELEVLAKEYELRGYFEDERFKDAKELQGMAAKDRLAYLRTEIGLTKQMKLDLMVEEHGYDVIMQNDQQEFLALQQATDLDFRDEQNTLNRELEEKLQGLDIESREAINAAQIAAQKAIASMNIASQEGMQVKGFSHAEKMQAGQQAFDKVMQERGFEQEKFIQERELAVRVSMNEASIASQEKIAEKKIQADKEMQDKQIAFEKEQKEEDRKLERFKEVQQLRGKDPVRAALMAMGAGDALDEFSGGYGSLGAMEGADVLQADTQEALMGIEGLGAAGEQITLGDTGVEGLQSVEKAGRSFVSGPASTRTLVTSAQGVGGATQAGVSEEDVSARIQAITPKGFQNKTAARGVGPQLSPTNAYNRQYAAEGRGPRANAPRAIGAVDRPAVEPNTSYVVGEGQKGDGTRPEVATTGPNKELLSIEPATNDPVTTQPRLLGAPDRAPQDSQGTTLPVNTGGDPLIDMFNDPQLTINRGGQTLPPMAQGTPPPVNSPQAEVIKMQRLEGIRAKKARGEQLTLEEEAEWNEFNARQPSAQPGLTPTTNNVPMADRRRAYMESLPPAQQAAIRQSQQRKLRAQQDNLVNNLTPQTVEKLMQLINNPNRQVNTNLQEQLPQLRDGAGNLRQSEPASLARVV